MAQELGQTNDPKELVPGDSRSVSNTMWSLRDYGDALHAAGTGLRTIDTTDGWSGAAGDNFRQVFHGQPDKWLEAGDCFHSAANALDSYVSTLTWAQGKASDAITQWNQGQAATAQAQAAHEQAVRQAAQNAAATGTTAPDIPFHDPGEQQRAAARKTLNDARAKLRAAGDTANRTVGEARDKAPKKPGFWAKVGHAFEDVGTTLENAGADLVNGLASVGNAMVQHPGDMAGLLGGALLTTVSAAGDVAGTVLAATGVGTVPGVALDAISTVGVVGGVTMMAASAGDLGSHAAGDDSVQPIQRGGSGDDVPEPTEPSEDAQGIAQHSLARRGQPDGGDHFVYGVEPTQQATAQYVDRVLYEEIPTEQKPLTGGRIAYWDDQRQAIVIEDPNGPGSVFTPSEGKAYFDDLPEAGQ
jgi:hypothetical protein